MRDFHKYGWCGVLLLQSFSMCVLMPVHDHHKHVNIACAYVGNAVKHFNNMWVNSIEFFVTFNNFRYNSLNLNQSLAFFSTNFNLIER